MSKQRVSKSKSRQEIELQSNSRVLIRGGLLILIACLCCISYPFFNESAVSMADYWWYSTLKIAPEGGALQGCLFWIVILSCGWSLVGLIFFSVDLSDRGFVKILNYTYKWKIVSSMPSAR